MVFSVVENISFSGFKESSKMLGCIKLAIPSKAHQDIRAVVQEILVNKALKPIHRREMISLLMHIASRH